MPSGQIKSRQRVSDHGEVFTPAWLVSDMCDLVADECQRLESRFLEPACGEGAFLAEVLNRKLGAAGRKYPGRLLAPDYQRAATQALMSLYGVELLADNARICRERLLALWQTAFQEHCGNAPDADVVQAAAFILAKNILCGDALSMTCADKSPIIFAEWAFIGPLLVKRRDFRLDTLLAANADAQGGQVPLGVADVDYDNTRHEYLPKPLREFPPCDYRKIWQHD